MKTWLVLTRYGQSNYLKQSNYMGALFYICKGKAKTTLIEFERSKSPFRISLLILVAFTPKKRSLVTDRKEKGGRKFCQTKR